MQRLFAGFRNLFIPFGLLLVLSQACVAEQRFVIEPEKSSINFTLIDTLHIVHGSFNLRASTITFDRNAAKIGGLITVDALSGHSGNSTRDKRMNKEELRAETFRDVTFTPISYTGTLNPTGDSALQVTGNFTILGTKHLITVPLQVQINGNLCHASGSFQVPYVEWGLKDPSAFLIKVNKEVQIDLMLSGSIQ